MTMNIFIKIKIDASFLQFSFYGGRGLNIKLCVYYALFYQPIIAHEDTNRF